VPGRFDPLPPSSPLTGRLVGVFGAVVQVAMLAVFDTGQELAQGRTGALELSREEHPRHIRQALQEFAAEFFRRVLVPPRTSSPWPS
jgi:hypothetical protein